MTLHDGQATDGQDHRGVVIESECGAGGSPPESPPAGADPVRHRGHSLRVDSDALVRPPLSLGDRDDMVHPFKRREQSCALAPAGQQPGQMLGLDDRRHARASRRSRAIEVFPPRADVDVEDVHRALGEEVDDRLAKRASRGRGSGTARTPTSATASRTSRPPRSPSTSPRHPRCRPIRPPGRPCARPSPRERPTACRGRSSA